MHDAPSPTAAVRESALFGRVVKTGGVLSSMVGVVSSVVLLCGCFCVVQLCAGTESLPYSERALGSYFLRPAE